MKRTKFFLTLGFVLLFSAACVPAPAPTQQQPALPVLNTPSSQSVEVMPSQAPAVNAPAASPPQVNSSLTSSYTGYTFNKSGCMDLDTMQHVNGASCDVALSSDGYMITPQNGAQFSGYGSLTMFTEADCKASIMSSDSLGLMTDLYTCFVTNKGAYGVFVARQIPDVAAGISDVIYDVYFFISKAPPASDVVQDQPQSGQPVSPPASDSAAPASGPVVQPPALPPVAVPATTSGYAELHDHETIDMDFNGSGDEMAYLADSPNNLERGHAVGQYVLDGGGIGFALMSSVPSYETCQAVMGWYPGIMIEVGNIFCYKTWDNTYGYIQINKIEPTGDTEIPNWVMGFSYTTWVK